ncbi:TPA: recombinase family protein [Bacillus tropicus]|nr:hypothetical protein B2J90_30575 [Bacillus cereus]QPS48104.1 recombinase family protein [Bacillus tropicus]HDR6230845.1 recombinase family protein [Bacillus cereus biovar anthracis]QPS50423.1 recombinase family protein [Bacillus tropicus]HDR4369269.1 recombinase family protein [Bacillus cereus]
MAVPLIGYARVSTFDQNLDCQIHSLTEYECKKIIREKFTATILERPVLSQGSLDRAIKENLKKHRGDKSLCFYFAVYASTPVTGPSAT